ncbi:MAG: hypothetical protein LBE35_07110 [Clostridiales bacterium]|jgi:hypothetical protein|nr:hypothetical protein [Clostridiales bacterium]
MEAVMEAAVNSHEELAERYLYELVAERLRTPSEGKIMSFSEVLARHNINEEELEDIPMEYGVDFS